MSGLTVGGNVIPIAAPGVKRTRFDGADRGRRFDNSYSASLIGGAARDWMFQTPPVTRALADTYETILGVVSAQTCTGDVISIPTMCCAEITGWTPVVTAQGHSVVIDFVLHEVQSNRKLLSYTPGDTITGESFTRSTVAEFIGGAGTPGQVAINAKRDGHYVTGVRSLLLEDARQNALVAPTDYSNVAWTKVTTTVTTGIADPAGGTTACTLTATGANSTVTQSLAAGASIVRTGQVWLRRRTGTGTIQIMRPDSGLYTTVTLSASWQRFSVVGIASTARFSSIKIVTNADAVDAWVSQIEDAGFSSSEILTTSTRGADAYSIPFTTPPGEQTVYVKFVENGSGTSASTARVFEIASSADADPRFLCYAAGGYTAFHSVSGVNVTSVIAALPTAGQVVELCVRLFGDGSVDIQQSLDGATATSGTQSGALAFGAAWSGTLCWLNSVGATNVGFIALQKFKIVAGVRSLAEMRVL